MRTIKFRGKSLKTQEWLYGSHFTDSGEDYIIPQNLLGINDYEEYQADQNTVGQFTGLKDKNGVEIFEGDILKSRSIIHLVEYKEDEGAFVGRFNSFGAHFPSKPMQQPFYTEICQWWISKFKKEVIGNIHDNPELLKKKINFIKN